VRAVHRAQRDAHRRRNRRRRHSTLTQQRHLDELALRRRYLPRAAQLSAAPVSAFDHLFSPNQMAQAPHTPYLSNLDSSRYGVVLENLRKSPESAFDLVPFRADGRHRLTSLAEATPSASHGTIEALPRLNNTTPIRLHRQVRAHCNSNHRARVASPCAARS
jgi:hypothetical protein